MATKAPLRPLLACSARARYSLPAPVSPCTRMGSVCGASRAALRSSVCNLASPVSSACSAAGSGGCAGVACARRRRVGRCGSMAWAKRMLPSRARMMRSCAGRWRRSSGRWRRSTSKKRSSGWPMSLWRWRQSNCAAATSRRAPAWVMARMRPRASTLMEASGSTSRKSGDCARRTTQSWPDWAIRLACSTRRAAATTRFSARFWLARSAGERRSDRSSTAASSPCMS